MKVLDLFSGLGGWSQAFKDRGHDVVTIDNDPKFKADIVTDLSKVDHLEFWDSTPFDIILASPPCNCFSIASVYRHWDKDTKKPKDEETRKAIRLVGNTIKLILDLQPRWWILENPRGMLRNVLGKPSATTYFASWQSDNEREDTLKAFHDKRKPALKATDLWGVLPDMEFSNPLKWEKAPRGSRSGIQGIKDSALRAKIPYGLSLAVCIACEKEISSNTTYKNKRDK